MKYTPKRLQDNNPYNGKKIRKFIIFRNDMCRILTAFGLVGVTLCGSWVLADSNKIESQAQVSSYNIQSINHNVKYFNELAIKQLEESVKAKIGEEISKNPNKFLDENVQEESKVEETEEEKYIKLYCDVYGINYDKVYAKLAELTDNFMDEEYLNNYVIGESMMKGRHVDCNSKEMAILLAVRSIAQLPEEYGFTDADLVTGKEYETDLDYSHQIGYVSNVLGVDPALNYAICRTECGFKSEMFLTKNNPSGIKFGSEWAVFPSPAAGFIEQACELLKYKIDGLESIADIGTIHAPLSDGNYEWVGNVTAIYNEALENYESLFGSEEEVNLTL